MGVFGITRSEMDRAITRECNNRAREMETAVKNIDNRVEKLESDAKHITEHGTKIDNLEKQFKELDEKLDSKFKNIDNKFDNLTDRFDKVIKDTRAHVDEQVDKAIKQLNDADDRWRDTNTKLQIGMDNLNDKMGELVDTVKGLSNRTTNLEQAPAQQALEEKKALKKKLAEKVFDIVWKLILAGAAAYAVSKGINLF